MMTADTPPHVQHAQARIGTVLRGKYKIEKVLGVGGMASVYAAIHRNGRRVAVKMLHPEFSMQPDVRTRFLREGHAASAVGHPGAVVVLDDEVAEDGAAFLVMELLEGIVVEELSEQNQGILPAPLVLAIARELCDVLEVAHAAGIVHRDLKPANLFLTTEGRLKVLDFGLAQLTSAKAPKLTQTGMVFGTPAFMAPEQAAGKTSQVDTRTDVWAVGATMFALLSGETVHDGESAQAIVLQAATTPARSLAAVKPDAHPLLVSLVDRALALAQADRWPSAAAMRGAISEVSRAVCGDPAPPLPTADTLQDAVELTRPRQAAVGSEVHADPTPSTIPDGTPAAEPPVPAGRSSWRRHGPNWGALRDAIDDAREQIFSDSDDTHDEANDALTEVRRPSLEPPEADADPPRPPTFRGRGRASEVSATPTIPQPRRPNVFQLVWRSVRALFWIIRVQPKESALVFIVFLSIVSTVATLRLLLKERARERDEELTAPSAAPFSPSPRSSTERWR